MTSKLMILFVIFSFGSGLFCCAPFEEKEDDSDYGAKKISDCTPENGNLICSTTEISKELFYNILYVRVFLNLIYVKSTIVEKNNTDEIIEAIKNSSGQALRLATEKAVMKLVARGREIQIGGVGVPMHDDNTLAHVWDAALEKIKNLGELDVGDGLGQTKAEALGDALVGEIFKIQSSRKADIAPAVKDLGENKIPELKQFEEAIKILLEVKNNELSRVLPEICKYYLKEVAGMISVYVKISSAETSFNAFESFNELFYTIGPSELKKSFESLGPAYLCAIKRAWGNYPSDLTNLIYRYSAGNDSGCVDFLKALNID